MSTSYNKSSRIIFPLVILASIGTVYAGATGDSKEISIFLLATGLLGGMGMFLYGMEMMSEGMKNDCWQQHEVDFRETNLK